MQRRRGCNRRRPNHAAGGRPGRGIRDWESASPRRPARNSRSAARRPRPGARCERVESSVRRRRARYPSPVAADPWRCGRRSTGLRRSPRDRRAAACARRGSSLHLTGSSWLPESFSGCCADASCGDSFGDAFADAFADTFSDSWADAFTAACVDVFAAACAEAFAAACAGAFADAFADAWGDAEERGDAFAAACVDAFAAACAEAFVAACAGSFADAFADAWGDAEERGDAFAAACAGAFVDVCAEAFVAACAEAFVEAFVGAWAEAFADAFVDSCGDAATVAKHRIAPKRPATTPRRKSCAHASRQVPMHANARQRDLVPLAASADCQIDAGSPKNTSASD